MVRHANLKVDITPFMDRFTVFLGQNNFCFIAFGLGKMSCDGSKKKRNWNVNLFSKNIVLDFEQNV